jgi:hypothetical protein
MRKALETQLNLQREEEYWLLAVGLLSSVGFIGGGIAHLSGMPTAYCEGIMFFSLIINGYSLLVYTFLSSHQQLSQRSHSTETESPPALAPASVHTSYPPSPALTRQLGRYENKSPKKPHDKIPRKKS